MLVNRITLKTAVSQFFAAEVEGGLIVDKNIFNEVLFL